MFAARSSTPARLLSRSFSSVPGKFMSTQQHDPLRILFCGADDFSIYSLRAVHKLHLQQPETIQSIDVVCRPDKRVGRGLKQIQQVPIKSVARDLELPLHQIDTFTGWSPPAPADLIIAVSFGLLVPARILKGATYGGLNVHPSLLPDLRGPAPIQHALLKARKHTGISLQTMHPTKFDHGLILAQTTEPGVAIADGSTPEDMVHLLGPLGANLLVQTIRGGSFVAPESLEKISTGSGRGFEHAPKILPEDRHIDWKSWTADQVLRYDRVLGKLWDTTTHKTCRPDKDPKRITFHGPWRELPPDSLNLPIGVTIGAGVPALSYADGPKHPRLAILTLDGKAVSPEAATVEGEQKGKALPSLINALRHQSSALT